MRKADDTLSVNRKVWDSLPVRAMHVDSNLVQVVKRVLSPAKNNTILYIGFGEGQNLAYLAREGFDCFGTEISRTRLERARALFDEIGEHATLQLVESHELPFPDNTFDCVLAWQSLYYNTEKSLMQSLKEVQRVLKPGGVFISSMVSPKQTLLAHKEIAPHTYNPSPETGQEQCVVYALEDEDHIHRIYKNFSDIHVGYYANDLFRSPNFHWVIVAKNEK
ncbi:hypothetical protein COU17_02750 [Candidatus Kaiserbacteria bacterium CG10_big_fil_rev_8_21_14_0_10_49_17]|uniref:Methyltransferase type 11 domain-containing protein n=1 Tax=Candidatus Kaiserbacteria bacterium CG10_big_fil_rev_8_21_14_0_10_49_17 TaxID=1974609 RepID=A0A2M6WDZ8_9BACT|nr:MAG: hypothetical protein COU17_02750 [Candidatus Kaiserbacteria bacterium CG10_big_fil_rev_8_21_14_0_10_49_17]